MKWKKILSFMIVSVLVIGGFAVISGHTRAQDGGENITEVNFDVVLDMEDGIAATLEGDTHLFMHGVDGVLYQGLAEEWRVELDTWSVLGSYNNILVNPAFEGSGTDAMEDAIDDELITEPGDIQWLANDADGEWTVNPFAHQDIRFALQYIDREAIIEDLLDGFGVPRYAFMGTGVDAWDAEIAPYVMDDLGLSPAGDEDLMEDMIEDAMNEIADDVAFGNVYQEDGDWMYEGPDQDPHQIEIIIMARSEDWRADLGDYLEEMFQDLGFDAWVDPTPAGEAIPRAFYGDPEPYDNLDYHIYTGGWVSTTSVAYQHTACAQMYAPWFGFMQTYAPDAHYNYGDEDGDRLVEAGGYGGDYTVEEFDEKTEDLFYGEGLTDLDDYWREKGESTQLGTIESVRIFLTTGQDFYPFNPDKLLAAVPEGVNGYDTYFGPRTMRTDDGQFDTEILTGEDQPYMDNWNLYGGSADVYGEYQRRMIREYNAWMHPEDGLPMQVNNYWMDNEELADHRPERTHPWELKGEVEDDFDWVEVEGEWELEGNIPIPEDAVDYMPAEDHSDLDEDTPREWQTVEEYMDEEDRYAAVRVTIDVHEEHIWHDGTEYNLQDVLATYARSKELGTPGNQYLAAHEALNAGWWNSVYAMEWDEEDGTYTIWGDYAYPVDELIGNHYSMSQEVHPLTYVGWDQLHGGLEFADDVDDDYNYEPVPGQEWIHQISSSQNEDLVTVLEAIRDDGEWIPPYLDIENMPDAGGLQDLAMDRTELETQLDSVIDFIETYDHSYIGFGPFMLEEYDELDHTLHLTRWEDYGFPYEGDSVEFEWGEQEDEEYTFEYGYWSDQFEIERARMQTVVLEEDELDIGEDIEASGTGIWEALFPEPDERELTEDDLVDYRYTLRDAAGDPVVIVDSDDVELIPEGDFSTFEATIPTDDVEEGGTYTVQLEGRDDPDRPYDTALAIVTLFEPVEPEWEIEITAPEDGDEFEEGDTVTVEYTVTAGYEDTQEIVFSVDGAEEATEEITLDEDEEYNGEFEWEAEDEGDYELEVASEDDEDSVTITVEEEEVTPGFTFALLVLGAVVAVAIYYKKEH